MLTWTNLSFQLITNRKQTEGWLWECVVNQTIKDRNLIGIEAEKFKSEPNQNWIQATVEKLGLPDYNINEFPALGLGHPPEERINYNQYSRPRASKKLKKK